MLYIHVIYLQDSAHRRMGYTAVDMYNMAHRHSHSLRMTPATSLPSHSPHILTYRTGSSVSVMKHEVNIVKGTNKRVLTG